MAPLIAPPRWRWVFLVGIAALLAGAMALVPLRLVQVKMLPFDNKSEFQVILNMPEGSRSNGPRARRARSRPRSASSRR